MTGLNPKQKEGKKYLKVEICAFSKRDPVSGEGFQMQPGIYVLGCDEYKFAIQTNIEIYSYPKNTNTNKFPNIFV